MEFLNTIKKLPIVSPKKISQRDFQQWGMKNITLRDHQLKGAGWLVERYEREHGCILGDEMGLGKTLQSIALLLYLHGAKHSTGPFLILCPLSVVNGWESELKRASPHFNVLNYCGGKELRAEIQREIPTSGTLPFHILLAHYEIALKDITFLQRFHWQCIIVDEGHRLKNPSSQLHQALKQFPADFHLLLTGTPVQNNLNELYSLLSFVAPKIFPIAKLEKFVNHFSSIQDDDQGISTIHTILEPFLLRRTKSEVILDLPSKSEIIIYTGLSTIQRQIYKAILTKDLSAFGEAGNKTRLLNILSQLRKCINHPYLFDGVEPEPFVLGEHLVEASGKLFIIDKLLQFIKPSGHRVLIFSQMTRMLDIIQDYLEYRGYSYERLDGSVRGEERFLAIKNFTDDATFIFLLSTRAGGQGLNLVGADTVLFVDSDFNPQNDLQAAARAHRIGQTKPVKVIRLVTRDTAEEIILHRAEAKLALTQTIIEGGQFSHGTVDVVADSTPQLADILKFGLDKILESNESTLECQDLKSIIGETDDNGHWIIEAVATTETVEEDVEMKGPENMYIYEGRDYSRANDHDRKTFDELLAAQLTLIDEDTSERILRSEHKIPLSAVDLPTRKRKPLTDEQLAERRRKREEARLKRQKLLEENERKKREEKERKRLEWWQRNNYSTLNVQLESDSDESSDDDEERGLDIQYLVGDATQPQCTGTKDVIIVHCVDDSGRWGRGGLFSAISSRSLEPENHYRKASKMKDLSLGDAHVISVDDRISRDKGRDLVALIIAQSRDDSGRLTGIKLSALSTGLMRVSHLARQKDASVHLPRIGYATPNFNWYGTERLIRKHLASRGVPTYIYYFHRHGNTAPSMMNIAPVKPQTHASEPNTNPNPPSETMSFRHRWIPEGVEPLPDVFTGVVIYFHCIEETQKQHLSRYLIAYDGEIEEQPTAKITHILCPMQEDKRMPLPPLLSATDCKKELVTVNWLEDCLTQGQRLDIKKYKLSEE